MKTGAKCQFYALLAICVRVGMSEDSFLNLVVMDVLYAYIASDIAYEYIPWEPHSLFCVMFSHECCVHIASIVLTSPSFDYDLAPKI